MGSRAIRRAKAISGKEFTGLAGLFSQHLRCRLSYIALLCAFGFALPLTKHPTLDGKIILAKRLSAAQPVPQAGGTRQEIERAPILSVSDQTNRRIEGKQGAAVHLGFPPVRYVRRMHKLAIHQPSPDA